MDKQITVRKLIRRDRVVLSGLVAKLANRISAASLRNLISSDVGARADASEDGERSDSRLAEVGIELLRQMVETLDADIAPWFADLIGVSLEEFDALPFDVEVQIIEQLAKSKEANDFFTGALRLYRMTQGFGNQLANGKVT